MIFNCSSLVDFFLLVVGLMLSGYAVGAQVLQSEEYRNRAVKAASFIKKYLWSESDKELLHCCYVDDAKENVVQMLVFFVPF